MLNSTLGFAMTQLSDQQLIDLPFRVLAEQSRRNKLRTTLQPGMAVKSLVAGFDGLAGREFKYLGFVKQGQPSADGTVYGDDYFTFGYGDEVRWLVAPKDLVHRIALVEAL